MRVLLTAGRSPVCLDLARHLAAAGHSVHVADTVAGPLSSHSRAVTASHTVPSPRHASQAFVRAIADIVAAHRIDTIMPVYEEGMFLSACPALAARCFSPPLPVTLRLHDKGTFPAMQREAGLLPPATQVLNETEDLAKLDRARTWALKPRLSRAAEGVIRLAPRDLAPAMPAGVCWVAQEWLPGPRLCAYTVCRDGKLFAAAIYPVEHTIDGHSCVHFRATYESDVLAWLERFIGAHRLTGQISFDFVRGHDGGLFAIECNPRPTSGVHLFPCDGQLAGCLLAPDGGPPTLLLPPSVRRQLLLGMLIYALSCLLRRPRAFFAHIGALATTADVVFDRHDLRPSLWQLPILLRLALRRRPNGRSLARDFLDDFIWSPP